MRSGYFDEGRECTVITSGRVIAAIGRYVCLGLVLLLTGLVACNEKRPSPVVHIGVDPVLSDIGAKEYQEVLRSWYSRGYRNRTVINVSPFDGIAVIPEERLSRITKGLQRGDAATGREEERVTGSDYLFAAARMGILKRLYWVIPFDHLDYINAEVRVQEFLRRASSGFPVRDVESMRFRNGCVSGRLSGIEINICSMVSRPDIEEPVLVALDGQFFPVYAATKRTNVLGVMKSFFDSLEVRPLRADSVRLLTAGGMARQGYITDELAEVFRNPDLIRQPQPPDLWSLRDQADNMLTGGGAREALQLLKERGHEYPDDPYLILMKGTAELLMGVNGEGLKRVEQGCRENQYFCRGLVDAGLELKQGGERAKAASVFAKVLQLNPGYAPARSEQEKMKELPAIK